MMKKKILSVLAVLAMALLFAVPVLASGRLQTDDAQTIQAPAELLADSESGTEGTLTGMKRDAAGVYHYYVNGTEQEAYTGLAPDAETKELHYFEQNRISETYTGFAKYQGDWYYLEKGSVQDKMTSVKSGTVNGEDGWWYVKEGKVSFTKTVAPNEYGWWYVENGKVDFSHYGIEQNEYGWWRIEAGCVNFGFTGFAQNGAGWWYLENGAVNFGVTSVLPGTVNGEDGWWYVQNGHVTFDTTVAPNAYGWWYVENGKVDFSHWGIEQNEYGWWRIEAGCVNFGFTGFAQNGAGWWYLENGAVNFDVTNILPGTLNGEDGWWYIRNGHVIFTTTVAPNDYGWWYVENGKVNFSYNGLAQNEWGWWYIAGGCVDFGYNGVASNAAGTWLIENGAVNFSYTGTKVINGTSYTIENGRCTNLVVRTAYVGDSIMTGFSIYNVIDSASERVYAKTSYRASAFYGSDLMNEMLDYNPDRLFLMFGMNTLPGNPSDSGMDNQINYIVKIIETCLQKNPGMQIIVMGVSPTSSGATVKLSSVQRFNSRLQAAISGYNVHYYDPANVLAGSNGYIQSQYVAGDGIHWKVGAYTVVRNALYAYCGTL